jgi:hypothetical protein
MYLTVKEQRTAQGGNKMGYTRYWNRTEKPLTQDFVDFCKEVFNKCEKRGIKICNWDGHGEPIATTEKIAFNGEYRNDGYDLSHESFLLNSVAGFDFCKTARKPYDYAVRTILSEAKKQGFVTEVSSDGANNKIYSDDDYINGLVTW